MTRAAALPLSIIEAAGTGDLLGRTSHDVRRLGYVVKRGTYRFLVIAARFVVIVGALALSAPALLPILVVVLPIVVFATRWYLSRTVPASRSISARWARLAVLGVESYEGADTIDALGMGPVRLRSLESSILELWRLERYAAFVRTAYFFWFFLLVFAPAVLVLAIGAPLVSRGMLTVGAVSASALLMTSLVGPLWEFQFWADQLQTSWVSLARIVGVGQVPSDRTPTGEEPAGSRVRLTDVSFSYTEGAEVLRGVDLDLVPGETLAVVGPSGAGKSTLGRIIVGISAPTTGIAEVGGVRLVDLDESSLRGEVALVTQEHHVFFGTLADNCRVARPGASDAEILAALDAVGAREWADALERGIDTPVGADGADLAPAQAQQIALARILLLDSHTIVLDEATSLMDPNSARSVEESLASALEGRTVVAIAHRLHTAHDADRVAVMVGGVIAELGTHDELLALGGEYAELWRTWQGE